MGGGRRHRGHSGGVCRILQLGFRAGTYNADNESGTDAPRLEAPAPTWHGVGETKLLLMGSETVAMVVQCREKEQTCHLDAVSSQTFTLAPRCLIT